MFLEVDRQVWDISADRFYKQVDGHNYELIAYLTIVDVIKCVECRIMEEDMTPKLFYSRVGIIKCDDLDSGFNNDLSVLVPCFGCEINDTEVAVTEDTDSISGDKSNYILWDYHMSMLTSLLPCCAKAIH